MCFSKAKRNDFVESGIALQNEAMGGWPCVDQLCCEMYDKTLDTCPDEDPSVVSSDIFSEERRAAYLNVCAIAAQLAAEEAGLA